jgi:hypothetical protein
VAGVTTRVPAAQVVSAVHARLAVALGAAD